MAGKSNTLGVLGTTSGFTALGLELLQNLLGGLRPPPGPPQVTQAELALTAENAQLKAERYTDQQTRPLAVEQARQGAQIECLNKQLELREKIIDAKIDNVAQVSASGMQFLSQTVAGIQAAMAGFTKLMVPETSIAVPVVSGGVATAGKTSGGGQTQGD